MIIKVRLGLNLMKYSTTGSKSFDLEVNEGCSVQGVIDLLKMPPEEPLLITCNGKQAFQSTLLQVGDELGFFPILAGG